MVKRLLPVLLVALICCISFFSCRKLHQVIGDATPNYFPVKIGKFVTYDVDSIYYTVSIDTPINGHRLDTSCMQWEAKSQMKLCITDTTRDANDSLIYLMNVFFRHYDGDLWQLQNEVIQIRVTADSLQMSQDGSTFNKLEFPIVNGHSWYGNTKVQWQDPVKAYLKNWNYLYLYKGLSFNDNLHNYENTVTVLEDDESVNYPSVDSALQAYRTYAKEVYAYNIGMVYKEWTHWTYYPNPTHCTSGYTVVMRAIDHN